MTQSESGLGNNTDPSLLSTRDEFAGALTSLRTRLGLTVREVAKMTGLPSATLGGYFSGRHLPPLSGSDSFQRLLIGLGVRDEDLDAWHEAVVRLRKAPGPRPGNAVAPFRGLESYRAEDADFFVGREELVADLVGRVEALLADGPLPALITVVGASGSGKSSLLQAGLAARLVASGVPVATAVPSSDALRSAIDALSAAGPRVLIVDQFEQVFAETVDPAARDRLIDLLVEFAETPGSVVVLALRADLYGRALADTRLLALLRRNQVLVGPMDLDALRRVIEEPTVRAKRTVEPELVDLVLRDVAPRENTTDMSALPLLSHALMMTWSRAGSAALKVADYVAIGGVAGAVERTAEEAYRSLDEAQRRVARQLFTRLVLVEDDGRAMRRRLSHADLSDDEGSIVEAFVSSRILTATENALEISHEVLLTAWPRLRHWLDEDREFLTLHRQIAHAATNWDEHGRAAGALLRGPLLQRSSDLDAGQASSLTSLERQFIDASLTEAEQLVSNEVRRRKRLVTLLAGTAALALVTTLLSVFLVKTIGTIDQERRTAESARDRALSREIAVQANQLRPKDPALAMQLSLVALDISPTVAARSSVLDATSGPLVTRLIGPEGSMRTVPSPDGRHLASVGSDGRVRIWAVPTNAAPVLVSETEVGKGGQLFAGAFSADSRTFAAAGMDHQVTLLDVTDATKPRRITTIEAGPNASVQNLAFADHVLYAATGGPSLLRWRITGDTATALPPTAGFGGTVHDVAISRAGLIATASADGLVRLWRTDGAKLSLVQQIAVARPTNFVFSVAFSPDGRLLAAAAKDKRVRVWDVSGQPRLVTDKLGGFDSWVNDVAFSPDGSTVAAAASGGLVQAWNTRDWSRRTTFTGPANFTSISFLPSGHSVVTGAIDGVTRVIPLGSPRFPAFKDAIWSLSTPKAGKRVFLGVGSADPLAYVADISDPRSPKVLGSLPPPPAAVGNLDGVTAVSPDGTLLLGGTATGHVVAWRLTGAKGQLVGTTQAATALIENIVFSADGHFAASASDDGQVTVYDVSAGRLDKVRTLKIGTVALGLGIHPDNTMIAVGGADNLLQLFDLKSGKKITTIKGFRNYVYGATFSPDGHTLAATGADRTVRLFDVSDPDRIGPIGAPLRGPTDTMYNVVWSRSGDLVGAPSQDGNLWLWSVKDRRATLFAHLDSLGAAATQILLDPNSDVVFGAGADGNMTSWDTDIDSARKEICRYAGSSITREEWKQHLPSAPYQLPCPTWD